MKTMRDWTTRTNVTSHWLLHLWGWPQCDSWHGSNEIQCEKSGNACIFVRFRKTWECLMTCDICQALLKITKTLGFVLDQTCVFHSRDPLEVCIWERVNKINFFVFCTTTCCCLAHWTSFKRQILSKLMCQTAAWQQQQQKSEHNGKQKPQDENTQKVIWFVHAANTTGHWSSLFVRFVTGSSSKSINGLSFRRFSCSFCVKSRINHHSKCKCQANWKTCHQLKNQSCHHNTTLFPIWEVDGDSSKSILWKWIPKLKRVQTAFVFLQSDCWLKNCPPLTRNELQTAHDLLPCCFRLKRRHHCVCNCKDP